MISLSLRQTLVWILLLTLSAPVPAQYSSARPAPSTPSAPSVRPFTADPRASDLGDEEDRIWEEAKDAEKIIRRRGGLVGDKAAQALLQDLTRHLYPEFPATIRVHLVGDPMINAFAFPNGGLYFNLGLVARMESVSQLACVVGHEGAHFMNRHSYQSRQSAKSAAAFAMTSAMFGIVGALGSLAAISSIFGYSRELESEADRVGHARLVSFGLSSADCVKVFELMADEAKALDVKTPVMFASHPQLTDRIDSFKALSATAPAPSAEILAVWERRFQEAVRPLRQLWLDAALSHARYAVLIHYLERPGVDTLMPPGYRYYLAEAYRLRARNDDLNKAVAVHREVLAQKPDFGPSLLGLGMALVSQGDKPAAKDALKAYLAGNPTAPMAPFAHKTLQQLDP